MKTPLPMTPFDEAVSSGLRMLKLIFPFLPSSVQPPLAFFIKFTELQDVLSRNTYDFSDFHASPSWQPANLLFQSGDFSALEELLPYLSPEEKQIFSTIKSMQEMLSVVEMMNVFASSTSTDAPPNASPGSSQDPSPNSSSDSTNPFTAFSEKGNDTFDPFTLLMGMLSPEQQDAFHTYSELFSHSRSPDASEQTNSVNHDTTPSKGAAENGKLDESSCNENHRPTQTGTDQNSRETDTGEVRK